MADPIFTQQDRDALLKYRQMRRAQTAGEVGATVGNAGRTIQGKDPLYAYQEPGADNLTAQQRAEAKAKLADVLAKLAQAEREAQSSDQSFAMQSGRNDTELLKAIIGAYSDLGVAGMNLAGDKVATYEQAQARAIKQAESSEALLQLSPEGQGYLAGRLDQIKQNGGLVNSQAVMLGIDDDLAKLAITNPAQIPAYIDSFNAAMRATGDPRYANFDFTAEMGNFGGEAQDPTLLKHLQGSLMTGLDAAQNAETSRIVADERAQKAYLDVKGAFGGAPKEVRDTVAPIFDMVKQEPTRDMNPQVQAPPADADLDAKRAYVERVSDGKATVGDDGRVRNPQAGQPLQLDKAGGDSISYEGFARAYPAVRTQGGPSGASSGLKPTGQAYSRSGPTEDTIASIRKLRANIEQQMVDLDKVALSPLEQAKADALAAVGDSPYQNPTFALKAAQRTAAAENRGLRREDRALRDQNVLGGVEAAPLREKAGAVVRQGARLGVSAAGRGVRNFLDREPRGEAGDGPGPSSTSPLSPEAPVPTAPTPEQESAAATLWQAAQNAKTPLDTHRALEAMLAQVRTPDALREAAKVAKGKDMGDLAQSYENAADDIEYEATSRARANQPADTLDTRLRQPRNPTQAQLDAAQESMETDVGPQAFLDPFTPRVPGRKGLRAAEEGVDTQRREGKTLADVRGTDPLEAVFSMGDLATQGRLNRFSPPPSPAVPFERSPVEPPARPPDATVATTPDFESTGGDSATRTGPAKLSDVGAALQSFNEDKAEGKAPVRSTEPLGEQDEKVWRQFMQTTSELPQGNVDNTMPVPGEQVVFDPGTPLRRRQRAMVDQATQ